jgi:hypothetical protein
MEGSLVAYKVFTNGSTLQASEINDNLMRQSVAVFSNAAARTAAITSPLEGQVTWLEDLNVMSIYDGTSWKTSLRPTGSILQVVSATTSTQVSTTSTANVTTGLAATITPISTSSRIIIMASNDVFVPNRSVVGYWTLFRGTVAGTNLAGGTNYMASVYPSNNDTIFTGLHLSFCDSPNTTSAQTYTLAFKASGGVSPIRSQNNNSMASMVLMEVAG